MSSRVLLATFILLAIFTRFYKLNWGSGYFFHPDENNMAAAISQLSQNDLNPRFFAYGQFPLYLVYFSLFPLIKTISFPLAVIALRFWAAVFSVLSLLFFYLTGKHLFNHKFASIFTLLLIFNPGLIQFSHYGTTESILIFVFSFNLFLSLKIIGHPSIKFLFLTGLITGVGLATKITAVFFTLPVLFSLIRSKTKTITRLKFFVFYFLLSIFFFVLLSPYSLIEKTQFISTTLYETSVATGKIKVFYTNQFLNTISYLFQFQKIFPYTIGFPVCFFSLIGFFKFITFHPKNRHKILLLIIIPCLIFFLYNGQLYTKWTRFVSPIFFIFPFFCSFFLYRLPRKIMLPLLSVSLIPGVLFLSQYFYSDIRLTASNWINQNLPAGSFVLSEAGNVINLPITNYQLQINNFDFYNLDQNQDLIKQLPLLISRSQYILIPSRRIFKNQNNSTFPYSQAYYQNLFNGRLGFTQIKKIELKNYLFLNPENAEETWTVFDRPTIRIYKKVKPLSLDEYQSILKS